MGSNPFHIYTLGDVAELLIWCYQFLSSSSNTQKEMYPFSGSLSLTLETGISP